MTTASRSYTFLATASSRERFESHLNEISSSMNVEHDNELRMRFNEDPELELLNERTGRFIAEEKPETIWRSRTPPPTERKMSRKLQDTILRDSELPPFNHPTSVHMPIFQHETPYLSEKGSEKSWSPPKHTKPKKLRMDTILRHSELPPLYHPTSVHMPIFQQETPNFNILRAPSTEAPSLINTHHHTNPDDAGMHEHLQLFNKYYTNKPHPPNTEEYGALHLYQNYFPNGLPGASGSGSN